MPCEKIKYLSILTHGVGTKATGCPLGNFDLEPDSTVS